MKNYSWSPSSKSTLGNKSCFLSVCRNMLFRRWGAGSINRSGSHLGICVRWVSLEFWQRLFIHQCHWFLAGRGIVSVPLLLTRETSLFPPSINSPTCQQEEPPPSLPQVDSLGWRWRLEDLHLTVWNRLLAWWPSFSLSKTQHRVIRRSQVEERNPPL